MGDKQKTLTSSFWGFVESVKQKSEEIVSIYKEDLSEFSKTIVNDTTTVVHEKLADLQIVPESKEVNRRTKQSTRIQNQYQARIALLQKDEHTYKNNPSDPTFNDWTSTFDIAAHTEAISHLLTTNESVREFHTLLVPSAVSYRDFWNRYYFRLQKLEQEEQRRLALLKSTIESVDDEEFNWDAEDDIGKHGEQSERVVADTIAEKVEPEPEPNLILNPVPVPAAEVEVEVEKEEDDTSKVVYVNKPPEVESEPVQKITLEESVTTNTPESDNNPIQDDIDREIEQKYLQIQSSPTHSEKILSQNEDDEWASWE